VSDTAATTTLEPTTDSERLHALDAIRGVAILGVLLAYTMWNLGTTPEETWTKADRIIDRLTAMLVDNKFITLFACLFGAGIAQQWRRWEAAGENPVPLHLRRMGFLLGVGLAHAVLLRNGDILAPYALLGLALLAFRRASARTILISSVLLFFLPYAINAGVAALGWRWPSRPGAVPGGYLAENLAWLRYWYLTAPLRGWPQILDLVLVGYLLGRSRAIERLTADRVLCRRVFAVSLALAIVTRGLVETLIAARIQGPALSIAFHVSSWCLAATYGTGLMLVTQSATGKPPLWPLRAVGRMAFTNYLMQAVIVVPVCLAFGLFDRFSPTGALALALGIAIVQMIFSTWWLKRFRLGPLERVWRGVTYGPGHVPLRPAAGVATSSASLGS
jgi:uncharacterized protein